MKKLYAGALLTGLLCSCTLNAGAFTYVSRDTGFALNVPDQNIMLVGENMFAAENRVFDMDSEAVKTNGMHIATSLTAEQLKKNFGIDFTSEKFNADLANIKKALKTTKNPLQGEDLEYLAKIASGVYVNFSGDAEEFDSLVNLNKELAGLSHIDKVKVEKINHMDALMIEASIDNIGYEMKLPFTKTKALEESSAKQGDLKEQGIEVSFSDDGYMVTKMQNLYNVKEKICLRSVNNILYMVMSLYVDIDDKLPGLNQLYKLDKKGFDKFNKQLVEGTGFTMAFTEPQPRKALVINDEVSGRKVQLPDKWLYSRTDFSSIYGVDKGGFELVGYSAMPETSLEAADKAVQTFGIDFDNNTNTLKMDLSQLTMQDLLDLVDEGVVMASGNFNGVAQVEPDFARFVDEYKVIFDNPQLTKAMFDSSMQQVMNSLSPQDVALVERYLKAENFNYTFDINNYNGRFVCEADVKAHIPDLFKVLQEANLLTDDKPAEAGSTVNDELFMSMLNANLVPFDCYVKNQLYFDRSQRFNDLLYFTKGTKETANAQIMQQFNTGDLYLY